MLNLPLYVVGGGVAKAWMLLCGSLFEELRRRSYVYRLTDPGEDRDVQSKPHKTYVLLAELGSDAGLLGACLHHSTRVSSESRGGARMRDTRERENIVMAVRTKIGILTGGGDVPGLN